MTEAAAPSPSGGRVGGFALRGPPRLLSDERLARRAAGGDERAFEEIFRRYHQDLYRFCLATVSNPHDAQEALQNAMVKVMRALPGEKREIKLRPWLYRIARNEAVEIVRRRRDSADLASEQIAAPWEIAETAAARARLQELFSDLQELPERQRATLVMRELAGFDFDGIGASFETTPAVARQTLYEARKSLRQMEEGREMGCETVRQALSDADGRVTRRRDIRAHLRACAGCRAFRAGIAERRGELAAIAPLPLAVSAGLLQGLLGGQASGAAAAAAAGGGGAAGGASAAAGGLAGTVGAGAGKVIATSAVVKSAATVAVVAAVGVTAADRGGVIDLPPSGGRDAPSRQLPPQPSGSKAARGGAVIPEPSPAADKAVAPSGKTAGADSQDGGQPGNADRVGAANRRAGRSGKAPGFARSRAGGRSQRGKAGAGAPGPPSGMPASSERGQQTASARKPPQVAASPEPSGRSVEQPAPPPQASPPKAEGVPVAPPATEAPPAAPSPEADGGSPPPSEAGAPAAQASRP